MYENRLAVDGRTYIGITRDFLREWVRERLEHRGNDWEMEEFRREKITQLSVGALEGLSVRHMLHDHCNRAGYDLSADHTENCR